MLAERLSAECTGVGGPLDPFFTAETDHRPVVVSIAVDAEWKQEPNSARKWKWDLSKLTSDPALRLSERQVPRISRNPPSTMCREVEALGHGSCYPRPSRPSCGGTQRSPHGWSRKGHRSQEFKGEGDRQTVVVPSPNLSREGPQSPFPAMEEGRAGGLAGGEGTPPQNEIGPNPQRTPRLSQGRQFEVP